METAKPPVAWAALAGSAACDLSVLPLTGSDLASIAAMWGRCTLATRMARFHAPVRNIPAGYLKAALADPAASVVAAQARTGVVVALASLIRSASGNSAELGVLVEDAGSTAGSGAVWSRI
jgi:hypothetical protein